MPNYITFNINFDFEFTYVHPTNDKNQMDKIAFASPLHAKASDVWIIVCVFVKLLL